MICKIPTPYTITVRNISQRLIFTWKNILAGHSMKNNDTRSLVRLLQLPFTLAAIHPD